MVSASPPARTSELEKEMRRYEEIEDMEVGGTRNIFKSNQFIYLQLFLLLSDISWTLSHEINVVLFA